MSADKYPSIFSRQMETIVYICSIRVLPASTRVGRIDSRLDNIFNFSVLKSPQMIKEKNRP